MFPPLNSHKLGQVLRLLLIHDSLSCQRFTLKCKVGPECRTAGSSNRRLGETSYFVEGPAGVLGRGFDSLSGLDGDDGADHQHSPLLRIS
jgi:hypothetical protein